MNTTDNSNRVSNNYLILDAINKSGSLTHDDIVTITNLSSPTVRSVISDMISRGLIVKGGLSASSGGRQAVLYELNSENYYAVAFHVNLPNIVMYVSYLDGKPIFTQTYHCIPDTVSDVLDTFYRMLDSLPDKANIKKSNFIGLCFGVPGTIDFEQGISHYIPNLKCWENVNLKNIFEKKYEIASYVLRESHLSAYAENHLGQSNISDFIYILCNEFIASSVVINNKLYIGNTGNSGVIEDYTLQSNPSGEILNDDLSLMNYSLIPKRNNLFSELSSLNLYGGESTGFQARVADYLAEKIAGLIKVFDIPYIVLGGPYPEVNQALVSLVMRYIRMKLPFPLFQKVRIIPEACSFDSLAQGGCLYVIDKYLETLKFI